VSNDLGSGFCWGEAKGKFLYGDNSSCLYWPTLYLIDKDGHIRYEHIGEGIYDKTETVIIQLLADAAG
jgi:hypothetical protein